MADAHPVGNGTHRRQHIARTGPPRLDAETHQCVW